MPAYVDYFEPASMHNVIPEAAEAILGGLRG